MLLLKGPEGACQWILCFIFRREDSLSYTRHLPDID